MTVSPLVLCLWDENPHTTEFDACPQAGVSECNRTKCGSWHSDISGNLCSAAGDSKMKRALTADKRPVVKCILIYSA